MMVSISNLGSNWHLQMEDKCASHHEAKVEKTHDMETIFSGSIMVKFNCPNGSSNMKKGWWCRICRYVSHVDPPSALDTYLVQFLARKIP